MNYTKNVSDFGIQSRSQCSHHRRRIRCGAGRGEAMCLAQHELDIGRQQQGQAASGQASNVPASPPQVIEPLKDITVQEGKMAVFRAKVSNASSKF